MSRGVSGRLGQGKRRRPEGAMDTFELAISPVDDSWRYCVDVRAVVNGEPMPQCLDPFEFLPATQRGGRLPLFTCECGEFGCGGYYVDVECTPEAWVLRNAYVGSNPRPFMPFVCRIAWADVARAAGKVLDALRTAAERWPDTRVATDGGLRTMLVLEGTLAFPPSENG